MAREELGLEVITGDLLSADLGDRRFGAVVLGDVIEHLPRPDEALDRIASVLGPGGVVCMMLPDAGSTVARVMRGRWWSVIPTHVHYFTRTSIAMLLRAPGVGTSHQSRYVRPAIRVPSEEVDAQMELPV
jgi:2-polyprenyl-3-methyl-5-hydroxy-6-metoxy-1,4-benzoquinol methylase